ncbi:carboxylating nicotinate-nucleotide diphosphorylase [Patescibacteria group bacterium]|nr:carboxylating nicotinate-nucleotide diphosphorylase [Patescibacteria group bacterium]
MFFNAIQELILKNPAYKKAVQFYVWEAYKQDLDKGDVTTKYFVPKRRRKITAELVTNQGGIMAGMYEAEWFLKKIGIKILKKIEDGSVIKPGDVVLKVSGSANKILSVERTLLNLIQRMSGVATSTNRLASKLPKNIKLLATRKTIWGLMDKRAAALGGAATHRLNLNDAVLIKENHLALTDNWKKSFKKVLKKNLKIRFVEIEMESNEEVDYFLEVYDELKKEFSIKQKIVVMLDNFKPDEIKKAVPKLKKAGIHIELSGGISERNISSYVIKGISAISSGAITTKAPNLDISLNIV